MKRALFSVKLSDGTLYASVPLDGSSTQLGAARVRLKEDDSAWNGDVRFLCFERRAGEEDILPSQARFMPIYFHLESQPKLPAAQESLVS